MALEKGDKVVIVGERTHDHGFKNGDVVTYTGLDYPKHHKGQWRQFKDADGLHQYLLESHYEVKTPAKVAVAETLPTKAAYAVFNANDEIVATSSDREYARELKAALGGKLSLIHI